MVTIIAEFKVKGGKGAEFEKLAGEVMKSSRREHGNIGYTVYKSRSCPDMYTFVEEWLNDAVIAVHNESRHFKAFIAAIADIVETEPAITQYEKIGRVYG